MPLAHLSFECLALFGIPKLESPAPAPTSSQPKKPKKNHSGKLSLDGRNKIEATGSHQKIPISDFSQMPGTASAKNVLGRSERLRGFISSVDIREQKHFFFFQPVVVAEELECPSYPYLPPLQEKSVYTLVLDLDETLIHFEDTTKQVLLRPNVQAFLTGLAPHFEIVVFTAAIQKVGAA